MFATRPLLIIGIFCISNVILFIKLESRLRLTGEKTPCPFDDSKCLTKAAGRVFKQLITGIPGVETSDPLHQDLIDTTFPVLRHKLIDASLSGMLNCQVELMQITNRDEYDYQLACPKLTIMSKYEMMAADGQEFIKSSGTCSIGLEGYHFHFHGTFALDEGEKTNNMHIRLLSYALNIGHGNVTYNYKDLTNSEISEGFKRYAQNNWKSMVKRTVGPALYKFMKVHIKNKNDYLANVPIKDIFYEE